MTTGAVAIAGIWGTLHSTAKQIEGQKDVAREERKERRLEAAYLELLVKIAQADEWTTQLLSHWTPPEEGQPSPGPEGPDIFLQTLSAQGILSVYWSPRVTQLVNEVRRHLRECYLLYLRSSIAISRSKGLDDAGGELGDLLMAFLVEKEAFSAVDKVLRVQVAAELSGRHNGSANAEKSK